MAERELEVWHGLVDRTGWPAGPWDGEPDKAIWYDFGREDGGRGYPCMAVRDTQLGFWCGYVAVPKDHPLYNVSYAATACRRLKVHGGITFAGHISADPAVQHSGAGPDAWWIGFDCMHWLDRLPRAPFAFEDAEEEYRQLWYVKHEVHRLALQLLDMERPS